MTDTGSFLADPPEPYPKIDQRLHQSSYGMSALLMSLPVIGIGLFLAYAGMDSNVWRWRVNDSIGSPAGTIGVEERNWSIRVQRWKGCWCCHQSNGAGIMAAGT